MGDPYPVVRVAAVQASPVVLDREATVEKAGRLIREAAAGGAKLAVFPETWLPCYPFWLDLAPNAAAWGHEPAKEVYTRLVANSVDVPGPVTDALGAVAAETGCAVVMGINERDGRTLYNSIITIDTDGRLLGKHRKLVPTYGERLIWGQGDGSTVSVFDSTIGKLGGIVCWEHWMPLARHAMHVQGEQIHAALWPDVHETHLLASRHYAFEGRCFVIAVGTALKRGELPDLPLFAEIEGDAGFPIHRGGSAIIGPDGHCLAGPMGAEEGILYADLDFSRIAAEQFTFDSVGHYARPDVFGFTHNRTEQRYT